MSIWKERMGVSLDPEAAAFHASISVDRALWKQDIQGSLAHTTMLGEQGLLTPEECQRTQVALKELEQEIAAGKVSFSNEYEDIHLNIEQLLTQKVGDLGKKLHMGRSRNDQVALDLRLYLRDAISELDAALKNCRRTLLQIALEHVHTLMPGYTHLQVAQPISLAHHLHAYSEMLARDQVRLEQTLDRVNVMPLGAGALAGSTLPLNRSRVAELLGFPRISENSMDAVSDRDFVVDFLSWAGLTMMHLSRLSEEIILWSTQEYGFVDLPAEYCTGSSMMPQKKNPDLPELIRGKTGSVYGHLTSLLVMMKGLPLSYNKDMQEDKKAVFETHLTLLQCLQMMSRLLPHLHFNADRMLQALEKGFPLATDIAEHLCVSGIAFREAHGKVGGLVRYCVENKKRISELSPQSIAEILKVEASIVERLLPKLELSSSLDRRITEGAPHPSKVREILARELNRLAE